MITFGSLFAGIGGFDLGFEQAGMTCLWQSEIDPFCLKVLSKHWPDTPKYGDVLEIGKHNLGRVDLICGGFPCQDVSQAGKRAGLSGKRSGLFFEFMRIVGEMKPRWVVVENVPGLLTSSKGLDFCMVLHEMDQRGYGLAWRILDSQFFGVPQRRRRVFVVGSLGSRASRKVLFGPDAEFLEAVGRGLVSNTLIGGQTNLSGGGGHQIVVGTLKAAGVNTMSGVGYVAGIENPGSDPGGVREAPGVSGRVDGNMSRPSKLDRKRWKSLGNAVSVPVAKWIGERIVSANG